MNKKHVAIIIGISIGIAVIAVGSYQYVSFSKENRPVSQNLEQGNQTTTNPGKNYSVELHESVGVKANP